MNGAAYVPNIHATEYQVAARQRAGTAPTKGDTAMKTAIAWSVVALMVLCGVDRAIAGDLKDGVKIEMERTEVHPGMEPGMYVCAAGHLHIKGTVQNLTGSPMGPIRVAGKVFDADGKLLGTATAATKRPVNPNDKAEVNLEFLTVTGPLIHQVKNQKLEVLAVSPKP
jgi:hypothetical protein